MVLLIHYGEITSTLEAVYNAIYVIGITTHTNKRKQLSSSGVTHYSCPRFSEESKHELNGRARGTGSRINVFVEKGGLQVM